MGTVTSVPQASDAPQPLFSHAEIKLLQKQWSSVMTHPDENGTTLFRNLFTINDAVMVHFPFSVANQYDLKKTLTDARLTYHARRVIHIFDEVIESLYAEKYEHIMQLLKGVGATHKARGLQVQLYASFKEAFLQMLQGILKARFDESAQICWMKLLDAVISHMFI